jgi:hypothetical protein
MKTLLSIKHKSKPIFRNAPLSDFPNYYHYEIVEAIKNISNMLKHCEHKLSELYTAIYTKR